MAKVFIYPATSLILSDLVARFGHEPLGAASVSGSGYRPPASTPPPLQITPEEPKRGLKYAAVEVPSVSGGGWQSTVLSSRRRRPRSL